jgi:potassium-transporting ATPase KdpC subunit
MKELCRASIVFVILAVVTGLAYPFAITGLSRLFFSDRAAGSLVFVEGKTVGSSLIGQKFTSPGHFYGRPSANDYDAANSGGTNAGPGNAKFLEEVAARVNRARVENGLSPDAPVPPDLVLSSASGLDPDITYEAALIQVPRVAGARKIPETDLRNLVDGVAERQYFGGSRRVNVLDLNLKLDAMARNDDR